MAVKRARVRRESGSEGTSSRVTGSDDDGSAPSKKARKELTNDKRDSRQDTETATNGHEDSEDDVDPNDPVIAAHESRLADRLTTCAEAGVIETVTLTDFMCHEHLSIDLGPNMNFIIGHNGSGKSAILTAITVCLGGKAAVSGRGNSLKNFVRNGAAQATVTIRLKNKGPDAYNHAVYGDAIIIERKIGAEAGGGYTIKGADRQIHARRRDDLDAITDHFALAIENPMNVLSQDTARQFLANATPKTLYDLFMKGIELQQLEADHQLLAENIESTEATLVARGRSLEKLREQAAEAEKIYAETHRAREAQDEFDVMKNKMAWCQVRDVESHRDELATKVEVEQENLKKLDSKLRQVDERDAEIRGRLMEVERQMEQMKSSERKPIEDRRKAVKSEFDAVKLQVQAFMTDQRECFSNINAQEKAINATKLEIEKEKKVLAENEEGLRQQALTQQRVALDEEIGGHRDEIVTMEEKSLEISSEINEHNAQLVLAEQEKQSAESLVSDMESRLESLRGASQNKMAAYHSNMDKLLRNISEYDRNNRWKERPIGPMGLTMSLKHPQWSDIVETFFGARINGFLVSNYQDKLTLLKLMDSTGVKGCPVLQGNSNEFQIDEPEERFLTILRAIEWSDERVKRQLIITNHPEGALLIKERQEAELIMDPVKPPRHAVRAFAIDPDDPARGYVIGGGTRGSSIQQTTNPYKRPKRLTKSSEHELDRAATQIAAAKEKVQSKTEVCRMLKEKIRRCEQSRMSTNNRKADSQKIVTRLQRDLQKVKEELETGTNIDDGKLRGLQESLETTIAQKEAYEGQYKAIMAEKANLEAEQLLRKTRLKEIDAELATFEEKLKTLEPEVAVITTEMAELNMKRIHFEGQQSERSEKKARVERALAKAQEIVDEHTSVAIQICERVEIQDNESVEKLRRSLEDKQKAINRIRQRYGGATEAQIAERLTVARENLAIASAEVLELQQLIEELKMALVTRETQRRKFQKHICVRAKNNFVRHLSERDFTGKLSFKHPEKELHTHVTPADVQANMKGKGAKRSGDNKVLSGGEKSFTTICLLLSIWEAMGCPIRALDEFDVFMDSVNRGISMKMMIDSANESIDKQFIVITPQDMGGVKPTPTTKIHKLADPTRGVTRVNTEG